MSFLLSNSTFEFLFESAYIQRWNEFIRPPIGMSELDKQGHKAVIAFSLAKLEETTGRAVDYNKLIECFLFEFFERTLLTDIKPQIFKRLLDSHSDKIHSWAIAALKTKAPDIHEFFGQKMCEYFESGTFLEKQIVKAAHYLASKWEFDVLEPMNVGVYGIDETKKAIARELEDHYNLDSVKRYALGHKSFEFISLLGRLRFQRRWTTTPRTPETTVMGHMLITAMLSYFSILNIQNACKARCANAFFGGLFHDLPEALTRDIISPIKRSIEGIETVIANIEKSLIEEELIPIIPLALKDCVKYLVLDEFAVKIKENKKVLHLESQEMLHEKYNLDKYDGIDGQIINACDKFSAYLEARMSIKHGISSKHLIEAIESMKEKFGNLTILNINYGKLYLDF